MEAVDRAEFAGAHPAARLLEPRVEAALKADLHAALRLVHLIHDGLRRLEIERDRLLAEHGEARIEGAPYKPGVRSCWCDDDGGVRPRQRLVGRRGLPRTEPAREGRRATRGGVVDSPLVDPRQLTWD